MRNMSVVTLLIITGLVLGITYQVLRYTNQQWIYKLQQQEQEAQIQQQRQQKDSVRAMLGDTLQNATMMSIESRIYLNNQWYELYIQAE